MTGSDETDDLDVNLDAVAGKTYMIASPSVGLVAPSAVKALRVAMMNMSNHGARWVGDASSGRGSVLAARNMALDAAFEAMDEGPLEGVLWIDDDILMPAEALTMLASVGYDFTCGVYCQRAENYFPLVGQFLERDGKKGFRWAVNLPSDAVMRADGCGFGMVYTSAKMLKALGKGAFDHRDGVSEDLSFCLRAKDAGFQLYCLTAVQCGHLGEPQLVTYQTFREKWLKNPGSQSTEVVVADGASAA